MVHLVGGEGCFVVAVVRFSCSVRSHTHTHTHTHHTDTDRQRQTDRQIQTHTHICTQSDSHIHIFYETTALVTWFTCLGGQFFVFVFVLLLFMFCLVCTCSFGLNTYTYEMETHARSWTHACIPTHARKCAQTQTHGHTYIDINTRAHSLKTNSYFASKKIVTRSANAHMTHFQV